MLNIRAIPKTCTFSSHTLTLAPAKAQMQRRRAAAGLHDALRMARHRPIQTDRE
jgi:hypothetical protein